MPKHQITPEEISQILESYNQGSEPAPELFPKLFPSIAEKFDIEALDRAKIPTLEYAGKRKKAAILAEAIAGIGAAPLQTVRCFGETKEEEWKNLIVQGDNLQFLKTCYKDTDPLIKGKVKGKIKLIYIDPPFATKSDFGGKDGEYSYADKVDRAHFLETLRERLIYLRELLAEDGSIYVHLDQKMSHYIKIIMDEIFGKDRFINEVIWSYTSGGAGIKSFARKHDSILVFSRSNDYDFKQQKIKRFVDKSKGYDPRIEYFKDEKTGMEYRLNLMTDVWTDIGIISPNGFERTNYPTQKPEELIDRIIRTSSNEGDLVVDCFAGSGTTLAVSEKLGRKWIGCDYGKHAIYTIQKRIINISESKKTDVEEIYGQPPKPFCVVSSGAYDFTHVMDLRKNKNTYIDFVLALFQLTRDSEKATKFRLSNIYSLKDTNPVEVYPVWDDNYLKDVRIDEIYLQNILDQAGSRLHGDYYIITPESCANVGETTLKNQEGKDVIFHILTFPYKILEDISQTLVLEEQPTSPANINNLVTSTSFYFNEDVVIDIEKVDDGLKIIKFETKILDANRNRFEGLSGLAMILVDLNYAPGKPFDMDVAVYAKEIDEDGKFQVENITSSIGIIAIDKHGNESKPYQLK